LGSGLGTVNVGCAEASSYCRAYWWCRQHAWHFACGKASPGGYTILINDLALPSAPFLRKSLPINVRTDLVPLGLINAGPMVLITRKTLRQIPSDLFALFKFEKTNIKFGHGGTGTNSYIAAS